MPPTLRDLVGDIREAVERYSREQLVEVLVYVFKQYVVEGPAPLQSTPAVMHDDLEGMSFPEVIRALQLRLDLPELELLEVQGERVFVRVGGRAVALEAQSSRAAPGPASSTAAPGPVTPTPPVAAAPGVLPAPSGRPRTLVEEVTLPVRRPVDSAPPAASSPAAAPASRAPAPAAAPSEPAATPAPEPNRRGGLLEID